MTTNKIKEHTSWICPKCKEIYDADDWQEYHRKQIRKDERERVFKEELEFLESLNVHNWLMKVNQRTFELREELKQELGK